LARYADLKPLTQGGPLSKLEPLRPVDVRRLSGSAPLAAYEDFLLEVGFGVIGADSLCLYSGLVKAELIWGDAAPAAAGLLMLGDDMAGRVVGIRLSDGAVFEIDPYAEGIRIIAPGFEVFIRGKIANSAKTSPRTDFRPSGPGPRSRAHCG